jgi:hypothetical protein
MGFASFIQSVISCSLELDGLAQIVPVSASIFLLWHSLLVRLVHNYILGDVCDPTYEPLSVLKVRQCSTNLVEDSRRSQAVRPPSFVCGDVYFISGQIGVVISRG